jgi:hypothetical protein
MPASSLRLPAGYRRSDHSASSPSLSTLHSGRHLVWVIDFVFGAERYACRSSVFNPEYKGKKMFWTCNNYTDTGGAASDALVSLCLFTDPGQGFDRFTSEDPNYSTCWKDPYLS